MVEKNKFALDELYLSIAIPGMSYTTTPTGIIDVMLSAQGRSDCWRKPYAGTPGKKPKTLVFTDFTWGKYHNHQKNTFYQAIDELMSQGFNIYFCSNKLVREISELKSYSEVEISVDIRVDEEEVYRVLSEQGITKDEVYFLDFFDAQRILLNENKDEPTIDVAIDYSNSELEEIKKLIKKKNIKPKLVCSLYRKVPSVLHNIKKINSVLEEDLLLANEDIYGFEFYLGGYHDNDHNNDHNQKASNLTSLRRLYNVGTTLDEKISIENLEEISFRSFTSMGGIAVILHKTKKLKKLDLSSCCDPDDNLSEWDTATLASIEEMSLPNFNSLSNLVLILNKATNIKKLNLSRCTILEQDLCDLDTIALANVEEIILPPNISMTNFDLILNKARKIKKLDFTRVYSEDEVDSNLSNLNPGALPNLKEIRLDLNGQSVVGLTKLLNAAKNLKKLQLPIFELPTFDSMPQLGALDKDALALVEEIKLTGEINSKDLSVLLNAAKNLKVIDMFDLDIIGSLADSLTKDALKNVQVIQFGKTDDDNHEHDQFYDNLNEILNKTKNLKMLLLHCRALSKWKLRDLGNDVLSHIQQLDLSVSRMTVKGISKVLTIAKNLKYINLSGNHFKQHVLAELKSLAPNNCHIESSYFGNDYSDSDSDSEETHNYTIPTSETEHAVYGYTNVSAKKKFAVDFDTIHNEKMSFETIKYFHSNTNDFPVNYYRLRVTDKLTLGSGNNPFILESSTDQDDDSDEVISVPLVSPRERLWPINHALNINDSNNDIYYCNYPLVLTDSWQPLPSLSPDEKIIKLKPLAGVDYKIKYSKSNNLYYIKQDINHGTAATFSSFKQTLEFQVSVPKREVSIKNQYIANLVNEFKSFKAGGLKIADEKPIAEDYITAMMSQRVGACRHRAVAFKYKIDKYKEEKLLPHSVRTRVILNDCHAFVEVSEDSGITWSRHCLGGYPAELRRKSTLYDEQSDQPIIETTHYEMQDDLTSIDTMHDEPEFLEATLASIDEILSETRDFNSFFKTWDTDDTSIDNIKEYAHNVIAHTIGNSSEKGKNRLILTDSDNSTLAAINSLQAVAQSINKPFFYINSPDDLVCSSPWLKRNPDDTGSIMSGPGGKLHDFLISTVDQHPIIIVNYSNFKSEDLVRLNSLLDEQRIADGTPVPEGAAIIGVYNSEQPNAYSGADFYSRFNSGGVKKYPISKDKIDKYNAETPHLEELLNAGNIDLAKYYIINLHESPLWETMMFGSWKIKNNELTFIEGELQKAVSSRQPIVFLNPPKTKDFARCWQQALLTKEINIYGKTLNIEGLNLQVLSRYDFSLFRDLFITEKSIPSSLPCFVLNPSAFGRFIANANVGSNGELETMPGIIEFNKGQKVALHLTRAITKQEWSLLLSLCKQHSVKIHVTAAPTVEVPEEIKELVKLESDLLSEEFNSLIQAPYIKKGKVLIYSEDIDLTATKLSEIYEKPLVIDVSSYTASDLIKSIKGSLNKNTLKFEFHEKDCLVKTALGQGQTVILKGIFTDELKDEVASLYDSEFKGCLIIIAGDIRGFSLNTFYKHTPTIAEKKQYIPIDKQHLFNDEQIASLVLSQLQALLRHYDGNELDMARPWLGLSKLPVGATTPNELISVKDFEHQRLAVINEHLEKSPFVFIAGATGVGKSTFIEKVLKVQPNTNIFIGEESLLEWSDKPINNSRKILFIDEANLTGRDWMEFDSLYRSRPYIIINGDHVELTQHHKVIFAGNPVSYSADRTIPKLFEIHGNTVMFTPMSEQYIKDRILLPALELDELAEQARAKIVDEILKVYKFVCSKSQNEILISARELQMIALMSKDKADEVFTIARKILPDKLKHDFDREFNVSCPVSLELSDKEEQSHLHPISGYLWTESRQGLKSILYELIKLREFRQSEHANQTQKYGGLGGLIIEGEPGVGKSAAVIAALVEHGFNKNEQFYYIPISAEPSEKIRMLREAFNKGAIVILDEINSTLMLERELNAMLMGADTNGKKPDKPGFMLIGTQNPISMAGRKATSPAIMRRTIKYNLPDMPEYEMIQTIISRYKLDSKLASDLVLAFTRQYKYAKVNNKTPAPNFRDLLKYAEKLSIPQFAAQENNQPQPTDTLILYRRLSETNSTSLEYSDEKNNALLAIRRGGFLLQNASDTLKNDKDVVLAAVRKNGLQLEFASGNLKNDKDVAMEAINNNQDAQNFISDDLANDEDVTDAIISWWDERLKPPPAKRWRQE